MAAGNRDLTQRSQSGSSDTKDLILGSWQTKCKIFSVADIIAVKGSAIEANEVAQLVDVRAGDIVANVRAFIITQCTNTSGNTSVEFGDGDDTDGFLTVQTSVEDVTAGNKIGTPGAFTVSQLAEAPYTVSSPNGKLYTAADTIDMKITSSDLLTGKFALVYDILHLGDII